MKKIFAKIDEHGLFGLPLHIVKTRIQLFKRYLEGIFRERLLDSYSQYAEDLIIDHLLAHQSSGSYIDIGANDPDHFNNTKRFYRRGWRGVNVEPNPILFQKLVQVRGKGGDINLNIGIGRQKGTMDFHVVRPHALSTFSSAQAEALKGQGYRVEKTIPVEVWPLSDVLQQHQHHFGRQIDLLSIDVEGLELEVLDSHDWTTIRPQLVLIEMNRNPQMIHDRMVAFGYRLLFENGTNGLYVPNGA
jgi:FkbM family methyltransferase